MARAVTVFGGLRHPFVRRNRTRSGTTTSSPRTRKWGWTLFGSEAGW
jgi:hypothetical protein